MWSVLVVVGHELAEDRREVVLVEDDHMVQTFSAKCPDDAFGDRVRPRRSNGRGDGIDTDPSGSLAEVAPVHHVSIPQQMARLLAPRCRLDELAPDPGSGRVRRDVDMHQLAPTVGNEDQHVQGLEGERGHREQISSPEVVRMVGQERAPGLARRAPRSPPAITPNRAVADHDAQLEQLASDPLGAPERILAGDGRDQLSHLRAEMRTPAAGAGLPAPEQLPALPMPAYDRVRRDDRQVLTPASAEPASQDPHQLVPGVKPSTWSGSSRPSQDGELMA